MADMNFSGVITKKKKQIQRTQIKRIRGIGDET
jgi:hypothetical protein